MQTHNAPARVAAYFADATRAHSAATVQLPPTVAKDGEQFELVGNSTDRLWRFKLVASHGHATVMKNTETTGDGSLPLILRVGVATIARLAALHGGRSFRRTTTRAARLGDSLEVEIPTSLRPPKKMRSAPTPAPTVAPVAEPVAPTRDVVADFDGRARTFRLPLDVAFRIALEIAPFEVR